VRLAWREFLPWVGESPLATNRRNRLVTAVLAVLSGLAIGLSDLTAEVWLIIAIGVTLVAPLVSRSLQGRFDPFEPLVPFVLAYGVMFVARPISILL
jgi:hypothetical protein